MRTCIQVGTLIVGIFVVALVATTSTPDEIVAALAAVDEETLPASAVRLTDAAVNPPRRAAMPTAQEVIRSSEVELQALSLQSYAELEDWTMVNERWVPTIDSCIYWMKHRIEQVRRIVGDDAEKAAKRGWVREWPPYEGFPTEEDYARIAGRRMTEFAQVLEFKTYRAYVDEILTATADPETRVQLGKLDQVYSKWIEAAWKQVGRDDAYLGWNDLMWMGHHMDIE